MKSYKERLPMIDAAIEQGLKEEDGDAVFFGRYLRRFYFGFISRNSAGADYICTRDEFNQRAKELGYINGYKYGVEYKNNGEKPDLPSDVLVEVRFLSVEASHTGYGGQVNDVWWKSVKSFRIVDKRYKPKEHDMNDWYEKGELPPVGEVVEAMTENKTWIECQVLHHRVNNSGMNVAACMSTRTHGLFWSADFKPLRTERDALVERAMISLEGNFETGSYQRKMAGALIDAGWRPIKPMSEQEFMKKCVDICGHGDARLYRAGCRFIEQVKV